MLGCNPDLAAPTVGRCRLNVKLSFAEKLPLMIFDSIANALQCFSLNPHFESAFKWLQENPDAEEGQYEIAGKDCFVMIQNVQSRGKSKPFVEAHNKYLDVQIVLEGKDEIGWKDRATCHDVWQEYGAENDAALWNDAADFFVPVMPGQFLILFPEDAHAPLSGEGNLKKAVFKIRHEF